MSDPPKKRGAPPGNKNALKHGLYSKDLVLDFTACQREGIFTEITYIRAVLDCVMTVIPTLTNPDHLLPMAFKWSQIHPSSFLICSSALVPVRKIVNSRLLARQSKK